MFLLLPFICSPFLFAAGRQQAACLLYYPLPSKSKPAAPAASLQFPCSCLFHDFFPASLPPRQAPQRSHLPIPACLPLYMAPIFWVAGGVPPCPAARRPPPAKAGRPRPRLIPPVLFLKPIHIPGSIFDWHSVLKQAILSLFPPP